MKNILTVNEVIVDGEKFLHCKVVDNKRFEEVKKQIGRTFYSSKGVGISLEDIDKGFVIKSIKGLSKQCVDNIFYAINEFNEKYSESSCLYNQTSLIVIFNKFIEEGKAIVYELNRDDVKDMSLLQSLSFLNKKSISKKKINMSDIEDCFEYNENKIVVIHASGSTK